MKLNQLKIMSLLINTMLLLALVAPTFVFSADAIQPHESIHNAAHDHAKNGLTSYAIPPTITVNRIDSRLRLPKCNQPLDTFSPPAGRKLGRTTVGVRCSGNKPWSLYVPVMISLNTDVVVAASNLARGTILSATDLMLDTKDVARLRGNYFSNPSQAIGKTLKRNLQRGRVLDSKYIATPDAIKKGSKVIILAHSSNIQVRMPGKALSNGSIGTLIKVRNSHSKKTLEAIVVSPGVVKVAM